MLICSLTLKVVELIFATLTSENMLKLLIKRRRLRSRKILKREITARLRKTAYTV